MNVIDELYSENQLNLPKIELMRLLESLRETKRHEIEEIKAKITKYEEKRRAEEVVYQSLSPLRKFFTGRPSSQHLAVEYMVNVKERLRKLDSLKYRLHELEGIIDNITQHDDEGKRFILPTSVVEELKQLRAKENRR